MRIWLFVAALFALPACDQVFGVHGTPDAGPPDAAPPAATRWAQVAAGANSSCGVRLDHTLWCWGRNEQGQLGQGAIDAIGQREPAQVGIDADWDSVSLSFWAVCALKTDHSLWCWGDNSGGVVGNGTVATDFSMDPAAPVRVDGTWKQVSAGERHACGIRDDDTLWCWGAGERGQLGQGTTDSHPTPTAVVGMTWKTVSVGEFDTCAIASDDTLWCWGADDYGQVGNGPPLADELSPVKIEGETWKAVAAFAVSACGITMDGRAKCWGLGDQGQLGTQNMNNANTPAAVVTADHVDGWTSISGGSRHACGTRGDGELLCWGGNVRGQIGAGLDADVKLVPTKVDGTWLSVASGGLHTCAIDHDHRLWCAGNASDNALGTGDGDAREPHRVDAGGLTHPVTGDDFSCAHGATGMTCWGTNFNGVLGIGSRDASFGLQRPGGSIGELDRYSAGDHVCALDAAGKRYCWGANYAGQLGDGVLDYAFAPEAPDSYVWVAVASSRIHTCGIQNDGSVWCWGRNLEGQIGTGTVGGSILVPTRVSSALSFSTVVVGLNFSCGLATDANVYCWGYEYEGALGNMFPGMYQPTPTQIGSAPVAYSKLFAGGHHACAIDAANLARCWGLNDAGELGDGTTTVRFTPGVLPGSWLTFGLGDLYSCGIKTDHTLWCWGDNSRGQLGLGTTVAQLTPKQVGTDMDWDEVTGSVGNTCAMKAHDLYCWGSQTGGAVGDGTAWFGEFREVTR